MRDLQLFARQYGTVGHLHDVPKLRPCSDTPTPGHEPTTAVRCRSRGSHNEDRAVIAEPRARKASRWQASANFDNGVNF